MANVEELLRKQKARIEKLESSPTPRKRIARTGPTRPWQENLPQYQNEQTKAEVPSRSEKAEKSEEISQAELTDIKSTENRSTKSTQTVSGPTTEKTESRLTELESTESQLTKNESTILRSTAVQSTSDESTNIQSTEIRSTKSRLTDFRATKLEGVGEALNPSERPAGFFQLSYNALELMRTLEAGEYVVYQFLTLKAWGWDLDKHRLGSGLVRAAGAYVSQSLGIAKSSADKYLGRLVERGLLSLVEKSHKRGNTYRVAPNLAASIEKTESRSTESRPTSSPNSGQLVDRNSVSGSLRNGQLVDRDSVKVVDRKKIDSKSLSQASFPETWTEFTSQLTEKGRERAEKVFQSLKNHFPNDSVDEIAACPRNLERFGAPDGTPWSRITSPIGLMESSWPQLREFFRKRIAESQKALQARQQVLAERIKAEEHERREALESQQRREAFFAAFPDEQGRHAIVQKYLAGLPFSADGTIGQGIAIGKWWDEMSGHES